MNKAEIEFTTNRVERIKKEKKKEVTSLYTKKGKSLSNLQKTQLIYKGEVKLISEEVVIDRIIRNSYSQNLAFWNCFDFSYLEAKDVLDEEKIEVLHAQIEKDANQLLEKIIIGKCETLSLLSAFEGTVYK